MSAFMVSHAHINALLTFARERKLNGHLSYLAKGHSAGEDLDLTAIGQILLTENDRSVCYRYRDLERDTDPTHGYTFKNYQPFLMMQHNKKIAWVLKACDCYDYQACETDDYDQSIARKLVDCIRARAIRSLIDYEAAPWGIDQ